MNILDSDKTKIENWGKGNKKQMSITAISRSRAVRTANYARALFYGATIVKLENFAYQIKIYKKK